MTLRQGSGLAQREIEAGLVAALKALPVGARTDSGAIRLAIGCSAAALRETIKRMRFAGKLHWDRLELSASMLIEAEPKASPVSEYVEPAVTRESAISSPAVRAAASGAAADIAPAVAPILPHSAEGGEPAPAHPGPEAAAESSADEAETQAGGGGATAPAGEAQPVPIVAEVEAFLASSGMSATKFGWACGKSPSFLNVLRKGRSKPATIARVRAFIAAGGRHPEPPPADPPDTQEQPGVEALAAAVAREAAQRGQRRSAARSIQTVSHVIPKAEPEVVERPDTRFGFTPPTRPRRRIPPIAGMNLIEGLQSLLAETPADLIKAVTRKHPALWARCVALGRARRESPAATLYAALAEGLGGLEAERSEKEKA